MRTTISIPDEFYNRVKQEINKKGFSTINDYLLDLLRHQIDEIQTISKHQIDVIPNPNQYSPSISPSVVPSTSESLPVTNASTSDAKEADSVKSTREEGKQFDIHLSGKIKACPFCSEPIPVELAQKHYNEKHEGS